MPDRPNFIFFMPDSMRAESLACDGHPLIKTPNFDRVAHQGVRFDNCYCQFPACGPSRCSMMSGLYPHNTGCRHNEFFLEPDQPSMLAYLKQAGYHVEWHGKNDLYSQDCFPNAVTRCNQRPESIHSRPQYNVHQGQRVANLQNREPGCLSFLCKPMGVAEDFDDAHRVDSGIAWLESRSQDADAKDQPFALYLALEMPHPPYTIPPEFYDMYDPADVPELRPANLPNEPELRKALRGCLEMDKVSVEMLRKINAVYLGMVSYSDWVLGRLLNAMDRLELNDNTVLVLLSDHGDYAGDYGLVHKHCAVMEDAHTRVPFIWRGPGITAGHVVSEPVELFDLMATTLDLAGITCTHPQFARSLVPQLQGQAGDPDRAVFSEGGMGPTMEHGMVHRYMDGALLRKTEDFYHPYALLGRDHPDTECNATMIRTMTHKLVYRLLGDGELYDMRDDPRELRNLYHDPQYADIQQALEKRLLDWLIQTSDVVPHRTHPRGAPPKVWC